MLPESSGTFEELKSGLSLSRALEAFNWSITHRCPLSVRRSRAPVNAKKQSCPLAHGKTVRVALGKPRKDIGPMGISAELFGVPFQGLFESS